MRVIFGFTILSDRIKKVEFDLPCRVNEGDFFDCELFRNYWRHSDDEDLLSYTYEATRCSFHSDDKGFYQVVMIHNNE